MTAQNRRQRIRRAIEAARKFRSIGWDSAADAWIGVVKMNLDMYRSRTRGD